jgi:parallel beta-helix repeat protein
LWLYGVYADAVQVVEDNIERGVELAEANKKWIYFSFSLGLMIGAIMLFGRVSAPGGSPSQVWNATYDGGSGDAANSIAVDSSGNVYVTGYSFDPTTFDDYHTIKYDSSGNEVWNVTFNGPDPDFANGIAVDGSGNVYVTGDSPNLFFGTPDYFTIKYDSSGTEVWNVTFDSGFGSLDIARDIAVDGSGNVYVTGFSDSTGPPGYHTIKYNSTGNVNWSVTEDFGFLGGDAHGIAVDDSGNVYVTGAGPDGYHTFKYNSSGIQEWNASYDSGATDVAYDLAVDGSGSVYVTGDSNSDYYTIRYDSSGNEVWNATFNGPGIGDTAKSISIDNSGNVYVTGNSYSGLSNLNYHTIKYDSSGNEVWNITYDSGSVSEGGEGIAVDESGFVYVTGFSEGDYLTFKYTQSNPNEISSCTNIDSPGVYTLTTSITNSPSTVCINITASDVIFDGQGNNIDGDDSGTDYGVYAYNSSTTITNVTVKNLVVTDWYYGIYYKNVENSTESIRNNTLNSNNRYGIYLESSNNITLVNNTALDNLFYGISSSNNNLTSNNASLNGLDGILVSSLSNNNVIEDNVLTRNNDNGIRLSSSSNSNTISNNKVDETTSWGIQLIESNNNTISFNNVTNNWLGIYFFRADNNSIFNNSIMNNDDGVEFDDSDNNTFSGNNVSFNAGDGIYLGGSNNNILTDNNASSNDGEGITLFGSIGNTIEDNIANYNGVSLPGNGIGIWDGSNYNNITNNNASYNMIGIHNHGGSNNIYENKQQQRGRIHCNGIRHQQSVNKQHRKLQP